jgi:maltose alpha-D-glucosyltransferase / alpha-amylase
MPTRKATNPLGDDPLWYKDGVIYQLHVRAFYDSNNDGIGDFKGLAEKLDYLQDLGVTALWLLPFYPSPLKDDGYDIADYTSINPNYGSMNDFKLFMKEAHRRGLRVITELVINHTSDQHPWFQRARAAKPGSKARDFYVWSDTPNKYKEARIIFKDFENSNWTWDPVAKAYFWHRFYHHQPDLNFENPAVHEAVFQALDFWMDLGVDGLRLDAIPYLFERDGTSCENLPETHEYLKKLRAHVDRNHTNRMLLAEANQWPEDSLPYFGDGDECHVAFHFPLMPRLFMSVAMEDRFPIIDIMEQTPDIPDNCQWAVFLRNHDELTLEMVTDEDRDYMYRTYARDRQSRINLGIRRRLAPLLENHRRKIELMNGLLFSFPGTPIVYYGDEIGMGDNIYLGDRNGVRTPMQWSPDRNAGFSRSNPQKLYLPVVIDPEYHYEAINVEAQQNNSNSLLWWMKRLIDLRKNHQAFGRGTLEFLHPDNRKVLAFIRAHENEKILVVANLSRFVQVTELDLSKFKGLIPVELSGQIRFPRIGELPYMLTLMPHSFLWLALHEEARESIAVRGDELATFPADSWDELADRATRRKLLTSLEGYVRARRWYGGKAMAISSTEIEDVISVELKDAVILLIRFNYNEGTSDLYLLPMAIAFGEKAREIEQSSRGQIVARLDGDRGEGVVYEMTGAPELSAQLLRIIRQRKSIQSAGGELRAVRSKGGRDDAVALDPNLPAHLLNAEQSNTSILYGEEAFLKLYRRLDEGINPDLEISRFLLEKTRFRSTPPLLGALEYQRTGGEPMTLGMLQRFAPNTGDAWSYTLDELGRFFERIVSSPSMSEDINEHFPHERLIDLVDNPLPAVVQSTIATYVNAAEILGKRTGEMHMALASSQTEADFRPEPFSPHYQRGIYERMRTQGQRALQLLRSRISELPPVNQAEAQAVLDNEKEIGARFRSLLEMNINAKRIRVHGDYHLGQVLYTGKDFIIIDFEGEPSRPLSERRLKRSALRDVAGMLRSFHYAAHAVLHGQAEAISLRDEDLRTLGRAASFWTRWVSAIFLANYLQAVEQGEFLPASREELSTLIDAYLLEKALYEVQYELNHRPDWVEIPLQGILQILDVVG